MQTRQLSNILRSGVALAATLLASAPGSAAAAQQVFNSVSHSYPTAFRAAGRLAPVTC
ncbi:MAG: hypothetical protein ACLPUH_07785 [Steroidobacteraceae bacterium]